MVGVYKNTDMKKVRKKLYSMLLDGGMYYGTQKLKIFHIFTVICVYKHFAGCYKGIAILIFLFFIENKLFFLQNV